MSRDVRRALFGSACAQKLGGRSGATISRILDGTVVPFVVPVTLRAVWAVQRIHMRKSKRMNILVRARSVLAEPSTFHLRLYNVVQQKLTPSTKIFIIGFNLCGTRSLHTFFKSNGIRSAHWGGLDPSTNYAAIMLKNIERGQDILKGLDEYTCFSDLTHYTNDALIDGCKFFQYMYEAYPDSLFVLNTRPVEKWVSSKLKKARGNVPGASALHISRILGCTLEELPDALIRDFKTHHANVVEFFESKPGSKLCVFDIEHDNISKLVRFLEPTFKASERYWRHVGKS
jgi:hypothetical protein